jgi:hypothetical protein
MLTGLPIWKKECKFAAQVLYPKKVFDLGVQFVALCIKVVQYLGGGGQNVFQFNNDTLVNALEDIVDKMKTVEESGSP